MAAGGRRGILPFDTGRRHPAGSFLPAISVAAPSSRQQRFVQTRPVIHQTPFKRLLNIVLVHSLKELFKYKSFFLLVFVLILADRVLKKFVRTDFTHLKLFEIRQFTTDSARYIFQEMPADLWQISTDYRTFLIVAGLFLLKQIISLWPSSDMRRMHRNERGAFGIFLSLAAIRWDQVLWDAIAVSTICGIFAAWATAGFTVAQPVWSVRQDAATLLVYGCFVALFLPLGMAGFSFSSKLAVIRQGTFSEKLGLFFRLLWAKEILVPAWLFFAARLVIEVVFVVAIPLVVLLTVEAFWIRILTASLLGTPVYSYLKMASFKFFLEVYRPYTLVQGEFGAYYRTETMD
jgi:hypothetical protein